MRRIRAVRGPAGPTCIPTPPSRSPPARSVVAGNVNVIALRILEQLPEEDT